MSSELRPQLVPSLAHTCAGLPGLTKFLGSLAMSCPCPPQNSGLFCIAGWAHIFCQLSRAGLGSLGSIVPKSWRSIRFALLVLWAMSSMSCPDCDLQQEHAQLFGNALAAMRSLIATRTRNPFVP